MKSCHLNILLWYRSNKIGLLEKPAILWLQKSAQISQSHQKNTTKNKNLWELMTSLDLVANVMLHTIHFFAPSCSASLMYFFFFYKKKSVTVFCNPCISTCAALFSVQKHLNDTVFSIKHSQPSGVNSWLPLEWKDVYRELIYSEAPSDLRHGGVGQGWGLGLAVSPF